MDILFLCVVIFLFLLAIFDLSVGVSNDAVNFLNSSLGAGAGSFKRVLIVASIGVFIGAAMSNGMMDVARHGIFHPEQFSFYELLCIFISVMIADIILLDIFNSLGMPTSTTVSLVFELLGATFVVSLIKMADPENMLALGDMINTSKALSVILGIFLSVAIAFVFGTVVQFLSRTLFTFNYRSRLRWKIGIFGGICSTAIIYFLLIKGAKDLTFMTPAVKEFISAHTALIILGCLVVFTVLMQLLHALKVNVLKVVCLMGTFALAMAFAGNDLVNFIGVPLTGLASFQDYTANGAGDPHSFMMGSLNGSANTPIYFLIGAGAIMVVSLATSRKARNVTRTEISLSSQGGGDEMFGSSRLARGLVRQTMGLIERVRRITPPRVRRWFNSRFNTDETILESGASFDLIRGSVNLVLAGALIALGTSMKLPLSTTFVTFMVAMGTSLADRAWARESAVFRITGVISVIGGWFITAGAAFLGAGIIVCAVYWGGHWVMIALGILTIVLLWHSNRRFRRKSGADEGGDTAFQAILETTDKPRAWQMLVAYITGRQQQFLGVTLQYWRSITDAFLGEDLRTLDKAAKRLRCEKGMLKAARRKETLCLRHVPQTTAIQQSAWFHLGNNCCMSILYNLRRIDETCREHVAGNFLPLPAEYREEYRRMQTSVEIVLQDVIDMMDLGTLDTVTMLRDKCEALKGEVSAAYHRLHAPLREGDPRSMTVIYVYLNLLQETRELLSMLRTLIRAYARLHGDTRALY